MSQMRYDPDGEANQAATRDNKRAVFAAKMQAREADAGISVVEANQIQASWRSLPRNATPKQMDRLEADMVKLPQSYIAVNQDGAATVMRQGSPCHGSPKPMAEALVMASQLNIQTAILWSTSGEWLKGVVA